jgi:hypothetical protein
MTVYSSASTRSVGPVRSAGSAVPDGLPVVGVSLGHADDAAAEHWLAGLAVSPVMACTHLVREPYPHVAISVVLAAASALPQGEDVLAPAAEAAAAAHRARRSGRAVIYPGVELLVGVLSVAEVLRVSAIERVQVLGSSVPPAPETLLETGDFVRPQWMQGALTLMTTPAADSRIAPFEIPDPTPCCADH